MDNDKERVFLLSVTSEQKDTRLDTFLSTRLLWISRSRIQALIKKTNIKVNKRPSKPSYKLKAGDQVLVSLPPPQTPKLEPESVEFDVIHEDVSILVLNKPAGVVVHPAPGHATGTLVHGLLDHCRDLSGIGGVLRPGIVHRLDKNTSGLMVVAKTDKAHASLSEQFKGGWVQKDYLTIVHGQIKEEKGTIDLPIARHRKKRRQMTVTPSGGKRAVTVWKRIKAFDLGFSFLTINTKTGRTHQIRVHLSHIRHPVVGDPVYGYGKNWWKKHSFFSKRLTSPVHRQMLHAARLAFVHPQRGDYVEFEAPLPLDMKQLLGLLTWKELDRGLQQKC